MAMRTSMPIARYWLYCFLRSRSPVPVACTSTWDTSACTARSPTARTLPAIGELTARLPAAWRDAFMALPTLYGPADDVLAAARTRLPDTPSIESALSALSTLAESAAPRVDVVHIDLADLRGYHYQTGASFSVFTGGEANAIGRGERYDGIGKAFGRARPATGFTLDLRQLAGLGSETNFQVINRSP